jgi:hypothetical protein
MTFPKTVRVYVDEAGFVDKKVRYREEELFDGRVYRSWAVPLDQSVEYIQKDDGIYKRVTAGFSLYTENVWKS